MKEIIFFSMPLEDFKSLIRDCIKSESPMTGPVTQITEACEFFTEKEASKFLKVSKVTLKKWRDEGRIKFHRIGSRIRYKKSELLEAMHKSQNNKSL